MAPDRKLFRASIPTDWLSRGTGETISLETASVYDFMPPRLGARFMTEPYLHERVHLYGQGIGPFIVLEETHGVLAWRELEEGKVLDAVDSYKNALHIATQFRRAMAKVQNGALFSGAELQRFDLSRFGELEAALMISLRDKNEPVNLPAYSGFVREVGVREKKWLQLHQLFYFGESKAFELLTAPAKFDREIGKEYISLCVVMGRFGSVVHALNFLEIKGKRNLMRQYNNLAEQVPEEHSGFKELYFQILD